MTATKSVVPVGYTDSVRANRTVIKAPDGQCAASTKRAGCAVPGHRSCFWDNGKSQHELPFAQVYSRWFSIRYLMTLATGEALLPSNPAASGHQQRKPSRGCSHPVLSYNETNGIATVRTLPQVKQAIVEVQRVQLSGRRAHIGRVDRNRLNATDALGVIGMAPLCLHIL